MINKQLNILIVVYLVLMYAAYNIGKYKVFEPQTASITESQPVQYTTKYDVTIQCEMIASRATNKEWDYNNCIENLENAIKNDLVKGVKTL